VDTVIFDLRFQSNPKGSEANHNEGEIDLDRFLSRADGVNNFREWLISEFKPGLTATDVLIQDGAKLRDDIRQHLATSAGNTSDELLTALRDCFVLWISTFWDLKEDQKIKWTPGLRNDSEISRWSPGLYVRTGVVEMHVLKNFLMGDLTEETFLELEQSPPIPKALGNRRNWLDDQDINLNIRQLMTNAGWYPDNEFNLDSLRDWYERYSSAILNADGIFRVPGCDFYEMFFELKSFRESGRGFQYLRFPDYQSFYNMLQGHDVLFVTPFANEIQSLYDSGDLFKIWHDFDLPNFSLTLIQAPMSVYPNRPNRDWTSSFNQIAVKINDSFSQHPHSLFFASSGCYGLPICDMVFQQFGVASVYQGNWTNFLFGIRQNATESVEPDKRNLKLWRSSSLNKIEGVSAVDDGRYVLD
jgi:hypothetical protein